MLASTISIDAGVKADIRAVIVGNDALGSIVEKLSQGGRNLSLSSANSEIRSIVSKRFLGLLADPRPRIPREAFIKSIRQLGVPLEPPAAVSVARARQPGQTRPS